MADNICTVISCTTDIKHAPDAPSIINKNDSQLLFGEDFQITSQNDPYFYGHSVVDGYEGHVHRKDLQIKSTHPSHVVDVPLTHLYPEPNFKTRPLHPLSFLSRLCVTDEQENGFTRIHNGGWVFTDHTNPIESTPAQNPLDIALKFLGTPYLFGGRSSMGIDCAGLVQISLLRHGYQCMRDSKDQEKTLGKTISRDEITKGDYVFFKGHVGIMIDKETVLNATARTMDTRIEPLDILIEFYGGITKFKRISP